MVTGNSLGVVKLVAIASVTPWYRIHNYLLHNMLALQDQCTIIEPDASVGLGQNHAWGLTVPSLSNCCIVTLIAYGLCWLTKPGR